ncbi:MAG TPA: hypothetical protein VJK05_02665, partial [archaeon]|nr:hypothetical protein [archaeon]
MNKIKKTFKDFFHGLDKVLTYSLKEIDLIKSQRISIALMLLYPVLAVAALAFALSGVSVTDISFGETGLSSIELGVVLPLESDFFDLIFFRNELNSIEYLKVTEFNSKEELSNAIKRGNVSLGAIIIPPESDKSFIEIIFLHDDSSIVASSTFLAQARNAVNSIGFKKSSEILNNLISELDSITSNISGQVNKTDSLILQLESGNKQ